MFYSNKSIPKCYNEAHRKRHVKRMVLDSPMSNDTKHGNKALDANSSTSVQKLDEKQYKDEQFNDKESEVMKDLCSKAYEMSG